MFSKVFMLLGLCILPTIAVAQENYISCGTSGSFQFRCSIPQKTILLNRQTIESDYSISYQLTCNRNYPGPVVSKLQVGLSDGAMLTLNYNDKKENVVVGTGVGELYLIDNLPQELASRKFEECSLKIWDIKSTPSSNVIASWKKDKGNLESQLVLATAARNANAALAMLEPAVDVYGRFVDAVLSDQQSETELKDAINGLKSCANADDDPVLCEQTIDKIASVTDLFTEAEQVRLASLQKLLARISFDSISCPADEDCTKILLKKYLSVDDLAQLTKVKEKLDEAKGAGEKASVFGRQVEGLIQQLSDLKAKSGSYIQW